MTDGRAQSGDEVSLAIDGMQLSDMPGVWSAMPVGLRNSLSKHSLATVGDVVRMAPGQFARLRGVGQKRVEAFTALRELLLTGAGGWPSHGPSTSLPGTPRGGAPEAGPVPEGGHAAPWDSLEALLRGVAAEVSASRGAVVDRDRNLAIWLWHHGLGPAGSRTLDAIGHAYGLTRERVRQIDKRLTRLVAAALGYGSALAPFREALRRTMARCLGVALLGDVAAMLRDEMGWQRAPAISTLETLDDVLSDTPSRLGCQPATGMVEHPEACPLLRQRVAEQAEALLRRTHESEHTLDFSYRLAQVCGSNGCDRARKADVVPCCGGDDGETILPTEYVRAVLSQMKPSPLDGERVLGYWWAKLRVQRPKTEAIRAALHILGRPVHYSELTSFLREHNGAFGESDERYVLSQLNRGDEYVLTGKLGTYGLTEWDVESYVTMGDAIETLLCRSGRALQLADILDRLRDEGATYNRVYAALSQRRFAREPDGAVRLAEWAVEESRVNGFVAPAPLFADEDEDGLIL